MQTNKICFDVENSKILSILCGPMDEHIRQIANHCEVDINRHGECFQVRGHNFATAIDYLKHFYDLAKKKDLTTEDIQLGLVEKKHDILSALSENAPTFRSRHGEVHGRTVNQNTYIQAILDNDIVFGIGPAGTGKTYLAVAAAVDSFERETINRIVLVRPAVEAGEKLGFLPGDLAQKVDPYLRPLYDALYDLMGFEKVAKLFEKHLIEIAPLAFMRGRTLNNSFIILDEAQNTTPEQMKMFLTRIGFGSKAVITGDLTQIDLDRKQKSGLIEVENLLHKIRGIHFHHFTKMDVVRHPLVQKIVEAYEDIPVHSRHM
ncbi:MAG: phosphate starvation-inducible protein PhoH [Burkholderiales bacterium]|jgi:phosphate starvation-inducible PhoH-like protein|nr:phosphate starvation-inducible protein PhoH [Burkholderiales bacterium]